MGRAERLIFCSLSLFLLLEFHMTNLRQTILFIAIAATSLGILAQTDTERSQHHPAQPPKKATREATAKSQIMAKESMATMDIKMKAMREMHEKMMAAKTPEDRKALMADHMKAMQDGMAMMGQMDSMGGMAGMGDMKGMSGMGADNKMGGMPMDMMGMHNMMQKRMEMMTSMMQMMMDRLPASPAQ
jgi:hypothetical protein